MEFNLKNPEELYSLKVKLKNDIFSMIDLLQKDIVSGIDKAKTCKDFIFLDVVMYHMFSAFAEAYLKKLKDLPTGSADVKCMLENLFSKIKEH